MANIINIKDALNKIKAEDCFNDIYELVGTVQVVLCNEVEVTGGWVCAEYDVDNLDGAEVDLDAMREDYRNEFDRSCFAFDTDDEAEEEMDAIMRGTYFKIVYNYVDNDGEEYSDFDGLD